VIDAPHLNEETLITNDLGRIYPDGTFEIIGRADNVIVSAGHKIHVEKLERQIAAFLDTPFIISSLPDNEAGEVVVLVIGESLSPRRLFELWKMLESALDKKDLPRRMITMDQIPLTGSGKPDRQSIREKLAAKP
jgi:O-succinylbenzoic acid--CoA ligase